MLSEKVFVRPGKAPSTDLLCPSVLSELEPFLPLFGVEAANVLYVRGLSYVSVAWDIFHYSEAAF